MKAHCLYLDAVNELIDLGISDRLNTQSFLSSLISLQNDTDSHRLSVDAIYHVVEMDHGPSRRVSLSDGSLNGMSSSIHYELSLPVFLNDPL